MTKETTPAPACREMFRSIAEAFASSYPADHLYPEDLFNLRHQWSRDAHKVAAALASFPSFSSSRFFSYLSRKTGENLL